MWRSEAYERGLEALHWPELDAWETWMHYALSGGGKRLRPYLAWMSYAYYAQERASWEEALPLLRAIEILHTFTLVHDDVMDKSELRRGRPTIYRLTDENTAILIGDALIIAAYRELMAISSPATGRLGDILSSAALRVCHGQLLDLALARRPTAMVKMDDYLKMISEKTGALLGAALETGAVLGGASEAESHQLRLIGEAIGRYFQLQDDYLDAFGEETGKVRGGDIVEGKKTFLWLWAWAEASPDEQMQLETLTGEERRAFGLHLYEKLGLQKRGTQYLKEERAEVEKLLHGVACRSLLSEILIQLERRSR
ncbi:MAG: polyprenyl synthetase family protein [Bacteroidia bacterium]|nr:polyprenyl synthetase family protein [Bacteroidia bacterium]